MKIRTDFVTNSSSSSYVTAKIHTTDGVFDLGELTYRGFYTFWFHDPTEKLKAATSLDELLDAILYSTGEADRVFNPDLFRQKLAEVKDFSLVKSVDIECHEEIEDRSWDDPQPRDVWYTYDFVAGLKTVDSDCPWEEYKGYGDSLAPDVSGPEQDDGDEGSSPFGLDGIVSQFSIRIATPTETHVYDYKSNESASKETLCSDLFPYVFDAIRESDSGQSIAKALETEAELFDENGRPLDEDEMTNYPVFGEYKRMLETLQAEKAVESIKFSSKSIFKGETNSISFAFDYSKDRGAYYGIIADEEPSLTLFDKNHGIEKEWDDSSEVERVLHELLGSQFQGFDVDAVERDLGALLEMDSWTIG